MTWDQAAYQAKLAEYLAKMQQGVSDAGYAAGRYGAPVAQTQTPSGSTIGQMVGALLAKQGIGAAAGPSSAAPAVAPAVPGAIPSAASIGSVALPAAAIIGGIYQANRARKAVENGNANVAGIAGSLAGGVGIGVPLALATHFFGHKSTRDVQKGVTKGLLGMSTDPTYQAYVQGMRTQFAAPPPDPAHPFAGKYGSWDEYKKAGLQASDLTGVAGNIAAGGEQWAKLAQAQRQDITQKAIDANLYYSSKGDVKVSDPAAFQALVKSYLEKPDVKGK